MLVCKTTSARPRTDLRLFVQAFSCTRTGSFNGPRINSYSVDSAVASSESQFEGKCDAYQNGLLGLKGPSIYVPALASYDLELQGLTHPVT